MSANLALAGKWMAFAAVNGMIAVILGAFAAHALKSRLEPSQLETFEVGVRYQMFHAIALLAVAWLIAIAPSRLAVTAAILFTIGIVLFSGSLYGLVLLKWRWLGPITPIGGASLIIGWLLLAVAALRIPSQPSP